MQNLAMVPRIDVLRAQLHTLLLLEQSATPGPWGMGGSCVTGPPELARDPADIAYYGGSMVCESIGRADTLFVVAARNLMPEIAGALDMAFIEIRRLNRELATVQRIAAERAQ